MVRVKALPTTALEGDSEAIEGTGSDAGEVNAKLNAPEVDVELETVMLTEPRDAVSA